MNLGVLVLKYSQPANDTMFYAESIDRVEPEGVKSEEDDQDIVCDEIEDNS